MRCVSASSRWPTPASVADGAEVKNLNIWLRGDQQMAVACIWVRFRSNRQWVTFWLCSNGCFQTLRADVSKTPNQSCRRIFALNSMNSTARSRTSVPLNSPRADLGQISGRSVLCCHSGTCYGGPLQSPTRPERGDSCPTPRSPTEVRKCHLRYQSSHHPPVDRAFSFNRSSSKPPLRQPRCFHFRPFSRNPRQAMVK